jgi:membrane fusion protein (multidrug efflux system)
VAVVKGIKEGDVVVTSGQLKIKNDTQLVVNNSVVPLSEPNPTPQEH